MNIEELLRAATDEELKKLVPGLSGKQIKLLRSLNDQELTAMVRGNSPLSPASVKEKRWYDREICGLDKEGLERLKELETQSKDSHTAHHVDKKQLRYLRALKKMRFNVPDMFRNIVDPKALYRHLASFCQANDIPDVLASRLLPALTEYIETGHMRPVILVGEKGCGKTTALRLLLEEALHLPTSVIKIPQTDGSHGMTGDNGSYMSADAGDLAKARLKANSLLVAYIFDEIDKVTHGRNRASVDDELLSVTDESCSDIYDRYLEVSLVGLEHCPMAFTANDLLKINPILADRCTVIQFPSADAARIKSISRKYAGKQLQSTLYNTVRFDYELMDKYIDLLVQKNVTSLRRHQQMIEVVLENALDIALSQESDETVVTTEKMFIAAKDKVLGGENRKVGF